MGTIWDNVCRLQGHTLETFDLQAFTVKAILPDDEVLVVLENAATPCSPIPRATLESLARLGLRKGRTGTKHTKRISKL